MSRNWIRYCSFSTEGGLNVVANPSDPSGGIRVRFQVHQATVQTPGWAMIRLYNLSKETSKLIPAGTKVTLEAGYRENHGVIFHGTVRQSLRGKETAVDTYLDVVCGDGDRAHNFAHTSKALKAGSTGKDAFDAALADMQKKGVTLGQISTKALQALQQLKYPRAQPLFQMSRTILRNLAISTGATWSIQKGKLNFVHKDDTIGGSVTLNAETGLIGMPVETTNGIMVRCFINPTLEIDNTVVIDESKINRATITPDIRFEVNQTMLSTLGTADGSYKIIAMDRCGDTRGNEWYDDLTCIGAVNGVIPASQVKVISDKPTEGPH